jgi:heat shock protein HtpX
MDKSEMEGVLGHEVTHIANGDMVTMTLLQGIINAFVMFLARIIALLLVPFQSRDSESYYESSAQTLQYIVMSLEYVFMLLGTLVIAAFSRAREYRADIGGARIAGKEKMIHALEALQRVEKLQRPMAVHPAVQALKISNPLGLLNLFATHPPLSDRIARLKAMRF